MKPLHIILAAIALVAATSCSREQSKEETIERGLGKYVYIDDMEILHTRETCVKLRCGNDDDGHKIYGKRILETSRILLGDNQRFCTHCVNDKTYQELVSISERNKNDADSCVYEY